MFPLKSLNLSKILRGENEDLKKEFPTANFYTGSTSYSLLYLEELHSKHDSRLLIPTRELVAKDFAIYGGELGNVFEKKSINENAISGCHPVGAFNALNWSKKMVETPWKKAEVENKLAKLKDKIKTLDLQEKNSENQDAHSNQIKESLILQAKNLEKQITYYDNSNLATKQLIDQPFSIVYAFGIRGDKKKSMASDISNEMVVQGGCDYNELVAVFVPHDKIELVQSLLPQGKDKVRDIDILNKALNPNSGSENQPKMM